jgi:hypothetical protein
VNPQRLLVSGDFTLNQQPMPIAEMVTKYRLQFSFPISTEEIANTIEFKLRPNYLPAWTKAKRLSEMSQAKLNIAEAQAKTLADATRGQVHPSEDTVWVEDLLLIRQEAEDLARILSPTQVDQMSNFVNYPTLIARQ